MNHNLYELISLFLNGNINLNPQPLRLHHKHLPKYNCAMSPWVAMMIGEIPTCAITKVLRSSHTIYIPKQSATFLSQLQQFKNGK